MLCDGGPTQTQIGDLYVRSAGRSRKTVLVGNQGDFTQLSLLTRFFDFDMVGLHT